VAANGAPTVETCNRAATDAMGLPADGASGRPLDQVLPPSVPAKIGAGIRHCIEARETFELGDVALFGEARRKWDAVMVPLLDGHGKVERILITARETTERKLAENLLRESSQRYRLIADNVADLVVRLDSDLACSFVSPASRDLLGREPE